MPQGWVENLEMSIDGVTAWRIPITIAVPDSPTTDICSASIVEKNWRVSGLFYVAALVGVDLLLAVIDLLLVVIADFLFLVALVVVGKICKRNKSKTLS